MEHAHLLEWGTCTCLRILLVGLLATDRPCWSAINILLVCDGYVCGLFVCVLFVCVCARFSGNVSRFALYDLMVLSNTDPTPDRSCRLQSHYNVTTRWCCSFFRQQVVLLIHHWAFRPTGAGILPLRSVHPRVLGSQSTWIHHHPSIPPALPSHLTTHLYPPPSLTPSP